MGGLSRQSDWNPSCHRKAEPQHRPTLGIRLCQSRHGTV